MKERAKKEVNVMTPIPPICIKIRMIICPICVKQVATSTVVSPVTHTEVVEINKASINGIRCVVAFGNDSDQYHEHETEQEKQRGLDPCLHQRERLPG